MNKRSVGADYEKIAGAYLEKQGYEILEYNFFTRSGEIDLIAKHQGYLVFVEVKYRKNEGSGHPFEAVTLQKQKSIVKAAMYYLMKKGLTGEAVRFDVVAILGDQIEVLQNAFEVTGV